jgi:DNA polymerase sigma
LNINVIKRSHSEFEDYVFSDEEDDEESAQENEDLDEDEENLVNSEKPIKKEVVSFKKKKNSITANALLKMVN